MSKLIVFLKQWKIFSKILIHVLDEWKKAYKCQSCSWDLLKQGGTYHPKAAPAGGKR